MAVVLISRAPSREAYETVSAALGQEQPQGRIAHAVGEVAGEVRIVDIWESQEALDAFAARVMPAIAASGERPMPGELFETFALAHA